MPHILIVEDDPLTLNSLIDLLEAEDFQVTGVADGDIAQKTVTQKQYDLIVCDLMLPRVKGYEFLAYLRNHQQTANIPFIVLTGKHKAQDIRLGFEIGVDDYIVKPFLNQELIKSIKFQLEKKAFLEKCYEVEVPELNANVEPKFLDSSLYNDNKLNLDQQLSLQDTFERVIQKYVRERVESVTNDSSKLSSIAVCRMFVEPRNTKISGISQTDSLIRTIAQRLIDNIGKQAKIVHLQNGDFVMILPYVKSLYQAIEIVKTAQKAFARPLLIQGKIIYCQTYVGISFYPDREAEIEILLDHAQKAIEQAKKNRDDCYEIYYPNQVPPLKFRSLMLVEELYKTVFQERDNLEANYQPQIDLQTGRVVGYEALLRWNHPSLGMIPPKTLIPIAEDTNLIKSIETRFLFAQCQQLKQWHQQGYSQLQLAVNVSAVQFNRHNFVLIVKGILERVQLEPRFLTLELTEPTLLKDKRKSTIHLSQLKALGVGVALDNFGTGNSSLNYLEQFPLTRLKIDIAHLELLRKVYGTPSTLKYIDKAINRSKLELTVEKVETKKQLDCLRQSIPKVVQGNYLSPALNEAEFTYLLSGKSDWLTSIFQ